MDIIILGWIPIYEKCEYTYNPLKVKENTVSSLSIHLAHLQDISLFIILKGNLSCYFAELFVINVIVFDDLFGCRNYV
jgi:hypothetical protein